MITKKHYSYSFMEWPIYSFEDALMHNIKFLRGEYLSSPYHGSPVYDMKVDKLLLLHENGIITVNGQSSECSYKKFIPKTKHEYYDDDILTDTKIFEDQYSSFEQKSYLEGFIKKNMLDDMKTHLDKLNERYSYNILYKFSFNNESFITNIHQPITWLTRELSDDETWENFSNLNLFFFEDFNNTFKTDINSDNIIHFFIFINEPCTGNVEDILEKFVINRKTTIPKSPISIKNYKRKSKKNNQFI